MKFYITKWILSKGIIEDEKNAVITDGFLSPEGYFCRFAPGEWHKNLEDAKKKAEKMRQKRIKSLKKQVEKLEKLKF